MAAESIPLAPVPDSSSSEPVVVALTLDEIERLQRVVELTARRLFRLADDLSGPPRRGLIVAADDLAKLHSSLARYGGGEP